MFAAPQMQAGNYFFRFVVKQHAKRRVRHFAMAGKIDQHPAAFTLFEHVHLVAV